MAKPLETGNLVRVREDSGLDLGELTLDYLPLGWLGYVVLNDPTQEYPVKVRLLSTGDEEWFYESELEQADE